jgi:hypothetical protein
MYKPMHSTFQPAFFHLSLLSGRGRKLHGWELYRISAVIDIWSSSHICVPDTSLQFLCCACLQHTLVDGRRRLYFTVTCEWHLLKTSVAQRYNRLLCYLFAGDTVPVSDWEKRVDLTLVAQSLTWLPSIPCQIYPIPTCKLCSNHHLYCHCFECRKCK